ncbi:hypothetical protein K432DRAFT_434689 [Lepidopterella palustris CBS 459.81]|uniref:Autophagy-related protein 14 n=1 Tax=Lepidopterella palustris CBS 459.81 TaxID=1314670 RepID=A0A8E2JFF2_9PEZI|nr:hypothetical protein K432DRAFT_434689 [Lepidopterella palustris CBS 459.81]
MDCDVCGKALGPNVPLHCATCARVALYPLRNEELLALLDREAQSRHVKAVIEGSDDSLPQQISLGGSTGGMLIDRHESTKNIEQRLVEAETAEVEERISLITEHVALLTEQINKTRLEHNARKAAIAQRRSDIASATHGLESRRAKELEKIQQNTKRMNYKWEKKHQETVEARGYLCKAAAKLAGLKQTRRKAKDGGTKDVYNIGPGSKLRIYDLRDLNNANFEQLTASLSAVAQLLVRISHYLSVRLPAEITLPHRDYPLPTIFHPSSSYLSREVPFPGSTPTQSSSASPDVSHTLEHQRPLPRPRTLFLDRPLIDLSTQDPPAYSLFLEGVSLLAYNVAWLCQTQGMQDEFSHWEDFCPIGRNLFKLLVQQENRSAFRWENSLGKDGAAITRGIPTRDTTSPQSRPGVVFGELSHGTAHSFLGAAENTIFLRGLRLSPVKITDNLKALLLAEQNSQEWEVLDQKEWHGMEDAMGEEPVLVGPKRRDTEELDDGKSVLSAATTAVPTLESQEATSHSRAKGVNGWTKLKSRAGDVSK